MANRRDTSGRPAAELFEQFAGATRTGIMLFNGGGLYYSNPAAARLLDTEESDLEGWTLRNFLRSAHTDDMRFMAENPLEADPAGIRLSDRCWFRLKGKEQPPAWREMQTVTLRENDEPVLAVSLIDTTSTKAYEGRLKEQKRFLEHLMDSISEPLYVLDAETMDVVLANREAQKQINAGIPSICKVFNRDGHDCQEHERLCPLKLCRKTKIAATVEHVIEMDDGSTRYIELHGYPVLDEEDRVIQVIEHQVDVTERKHAELRLRESEQRYASLFENNHTVMLLLDPANGDIVDANAAACRYYGLKCAALTDMNISVLSLMDTEELLSRLKQLKDKSGHYTTQHQKASGEVRDVEVFAGPLQLSGKKLVYALIHDITNRLTVERQFRQRYDYEKVSASLAQRFIGVRREDVDTSVDAALQEVGTFLGVDRVHFFYSNEIESNQWQYFREWHRDGFEAVDEETEKSLKSAFPWASGRLKNMSTIVINSIDDIPDSAKAERELFRARNYKSSLTMPYLNQGRLEGVISMVSHRKQRTWTELESILLRVTGEMILRAIERKFFEERIQESNDRLMDLSAHIQDRVESERANIAREVHDELGQLLTALKFDVSMMKKKVSGSESAVKEKADSMEQIIDESIKTVQRISSELRPVLLDDLGLAAAIEWLTNSFRERTGIHTHVELEDIPVSANASIGLFRIAQEAMTNIGRHAFATEMTLELGLTRGGIRLFISDDGIGMPGGKLSDPESYGLMGLQERARFLDGTARIEGIKGSGTQIEVLVPEKHILHQDDEGVEHDTDSGGG